ncbi:hypothetical protein F5Y03DRAFT_392408 [Xylaria venustula]|nr:hypothetical protein F5Y03DRAFT_392408 [Xylaria venustula]
MAPRAAARRPPQDELTQEGLKADLIASESKLKHDIVNKASSTGNGRFNEGEYSSTIYPIDGVGPVYNGNVADPGRPLLSAKVSTPSLVCNVSESNIHQKGYELVLHHLSMLENDDIRKRAREGIEALLQALFRDVDSQCSMIKPRVSSIRAITLSIPAHWTLEFEELYRGMIGNAYEHYHGKKYEGEIVFLTEPEALAHFLCREHGHILVPDPKEKRTIVLIMDFGGHNMEDKNPGFYHLTKAEDAGGGSEQWEHYVAEECIQMMIREGYILPFQDIAPKQRQVLLDDFNRFKKNSEDTNVDLEFRCLRSDGGTEPLSLGAERVAAAHEKVFESAFEKANTMIKLAAALSNSNARIIVTGGSVKSKLTKEKVEEYCEKYHMSEGLDFMGEQGVSGLTMMIAQGAACAIAYQLSVEMFIDRGAAFGMQVREIGPRTRDTEKELWNNEAPLLFSKGRSHHPPPMFKTTGRSEFRIICDPFFKNNSSKCLFHHGCYTFLDLGILRRGEYSFRIELTKFNGKMTFVLEARGDDYIISDRVVVNKTWRFPMYTNVGANADNLGSPHETPEALFAELWEDLRPQNKDITTGCVLRREVPELPLAIPQRLRRCLPPALHPKKPFSSLHHAIPHAQTRGPHRIVL